MGFGKKNQYVVPHMVQVQGPKFLEKVHFLPVTRRKEIVFPDFPFALVILGNISQPLSLSRLTHFVFPVQNPFQPGRAHL